MAGHFDIKNLNKKTLRVGYFANRPQSGYLENNINIFLRTSRSHLAEEEPDFDYYLYNYQRILGPRI